MKLFISHTSADRDIVGQIVDCCEQLNIKYFLDEKHIDAGSKISSRVGEGLRECSHLLVVVSPASERSQWVAFEIGRAIERGMAVIPFLTHPLTAPPPFLADILGVRSIDALRKQLELFLLSVQPTADELVEKLATVPGAISNMDIGDLAKKALIESVNLILIGFREHLDDIEKGRISVRGPEIDRVFAIFVSLIQKRFRAVSRDDLDYWVSEDSRQYLAHNRRLLEKGLQVERIFVLDRDKKVDSDQLQAVKEQFQMGVKIRLAYLDRCRRIVGVDTESDLDFGLFDNFAVSFFRFSIGRVHKLSTSPSDCNRYTGIYDSVLNVCERFRGSDGRDDNLITDEAQIARWAESAALRS